MMPASMRLKKLPMALIVSVSLVGSAFGTTPALANKKELPESVRDMPDKLIKYEHLKNRPGRDGKNYDIKIIYGRGSVEGRGSIKPRRIVAFTRVMISRAGQDKYYKPSADTLSELFPGSMVYTSIFAADQLGRTQSRCAQKKWHKSREFTTSVSMLRDICGSKGFDTGHRARIGNQMVVDRKI